MQSNMTSQDKNKYIQERLEEKAKIGFKRGELSKFMAELAEETDSTIYVVRNIYSRKVKGDGKTKEDTKSKDEEVIESTKKSTAKRTTKSKKTELIKEPSTESKTDTEDEKMKKEISSNTTEGKVIDERDNLIATYLINDKEVRLIADKDEKYYVGKDVFDSLSIDRTSPYVKNELSTEIKQYVPVKSKFGYVNTLVLQAKGLVKFIEKTAENHPQEAIKEKSLNFLTHLEEEGYSISLKQKKEDSDSIVPSSGNINLAQEIASQEISAQEIIEQAQTEEISKNQKSEEENQNDISHNETQESNSTLASEDTHKNTYNGPSSVKNLVISEEPAVPITQESKNDRPLIQEINPSKQFPSNLAQYSSSTKRDTNLPSYRVNDWVEVEVIALKPYGVLVRTLDEFGLQGLIHIKEIKNDFVFDLTLYFEPGDKIKAQVKKFNREKMELSLSTRGTNVPLRSTKLKEEHEQELKHSPSVSQPDVAEGSMAEKLMKVKNQIVMSSNETQSIPDSKPEKEMVNNSDMTNNVASQSIQQTQNQTIPELIIEGNREIELIMSHLNKVVGAISPEARSLLISTINEKGITAFTLAMLEVLPVFKPDLGVLLVKEIENKARECL